MEYSSPIFSSDIAVMSKPCNIYADHAATTPLLPEALKAMLPYLRQDFGNPSSLYHRGQEARQAVEEARAAIGRCIHAKADEILFTSGGTESDNWALEGIARALRHKGRHIAVSAIEHHAVLNCCKMLENDGCKVTYLPVSPTGRVEAETLEKVLRPDTILVSIMLANNEIGTIQDIPSLARIAHRKGVLFHTDAVQAIGHIRVDVRRLGVDLLSASAHKFNGPQGCGFLYVKSGTPIQPFHLGGQQERGLRAGTENVAGIVGMATALEHNVQNLLQRKRHLGGLERDLRELLKKGLGKAVFNGDSRRHLPGHISVSFSGYDAEALLHLLDLKGISVSTGAACNSKATEVSYVLQAIKLAPEVAKGTLRITLGDDNNHQDVHTIAETILSILPKVQGKQ